MEQETLERLLAEVESLAKVYSDEAKSFREGARPDLSLVLSRCERDLLKVRDQFTAEPSPNRC